MIEALLICSAFFIVMKNLKAFKYKAEFTRKENDKDAL